jgi:bifunctional DNA-binding transcriptional regulator/antitoxin component of YhaV-PrlF toxin-antitoxin module
MSVLQQGTDGKFTVTIPKHLVKAKAFKRGDVIGFAVVDDINRPQPGDIFLRRDAAAAKR